LKLNHVWLSDNDILVYTVDHRFIAS
jgi:hypothetical protein